MLATGTHVRDMQRDVSRTLLSSKRRSSYISRSRCIRVTLTRVFVTKTNVNNTKRTSRTIRNNVELLWKLRQSKRASFERNYAFRNLPLFQSVELRRRRLWRPLNRYVPGGYMRGCEWKIGLRYTKRFWLRRNPSSATELSWAIPLLSGW